MHQIQGKDVATFHGEGAPEIRATILSQKARVDLAIFPEGNAAVLALTLGDLLSIADEEKDGERIEIGPPNIREFHSSSGSLVAANNSLSAANTSLTTQLSEARTKLSAAEAEASSLRVQLAAAKAAAAPASDPAAAHQGS